MGIETLASVLVEQCVELDTKFEEGIDDGFNIDILRSVVGDEPCDESRFILSNVEVPMLIAEERMGESCVLGR